MASGELRPMWVYERVGARYSVVRGNARKVVAGSTIVAHWSHADRGYLVRTDRLPELLARAELDGEFVVRVRRIEMAP